MQENVNAVNVLNSIVQNFGDERVSTCDGGIIKLSVKSLGNGDILNISNMLQWADVQMKRSDKGILVLFIPKIHSGGYSQEILDALDATNNNDNYKGPVNTVRDYYERLPQDVRMKAFDNTSKNKWMMPVDSLEQAILRSFYINNSPEGTEYWQDVIVENAKN